MNASQKELRAAGLVVTVPRLKVLELMEHEKDKHMTADDIYKKLVEDNHDISLGTVYRVLTQFEAAGLVIRRQFEKGRAYYELDSGSHHDHMICTQCGKIMEFFDDIHEDRLEKISTEKKCKLNDHFLVLYVTCPDCSHDCD